MTDEAPALTPEQQRVIETALVGLQRGVERTFGSLIDQTLLVQHVANAKALKHACDNLLHAVEDLEVPTMVRYVSRPHVSRANEQQIVDLQSFRAPTDLRGLQA